MLLKYSLPLSAALMPVFLLAHVSLPTAIPSSRTIAKVNSRPYYRGFPAGGGVGVPALNNGISESGRLYNHRLREQHSRERQFYKWANNQGLPEYASVGEGCKLNWRGLAFPVQTELSIVVRRNIILYTNTCINWQSPTGGTLCTLLIYSKG